MDVKWFSNPQNENSIERVIWGYKWGYI